MAESVSLTVNGMKCGGCENKVVAALTALTGVVTVKASFADNLVEVEYNVEQIHPDDIEDAIIAAGFKVE